MNLSPQPPPLRALQGQPPWLVVAVAVPGPVRPEPGRRADRQRQTAGWCATTATGTSRPQALPETTFGGEFPLEANYKSPYIRELLKKGRLVLWAPIPFSYQSINYDLQVPAPAPPSADNWLGTDDQGRDVLARVIYGFRMSVLFALTLTVLSSIIGVIAGALQGFYGGWVDLAGQRFLEIWSGCRCCTC
jgi:ABC-type dipeptide/oligopeptide/nickel transport system permease subunit